MSGHDDDHHHHHDHDHEHGSELSPMDLRVRALQSLLTAKGYIDPEALDRIVDTYETRVGPRNGAAKKVSRYPACVLRGRRPVS